MDFGILLDDSGQSTVLRLISLCSIAGIMQGISSLVSRKWYAVLWNTAILVLPAGIFWIINDTQSFFSVLTYLDGTAFLSHPLLFGIGYLLTAVFGIIGISVSWRRWTQTDFLH